MTAHQSAILPAEIGWGLIAILSVIWVALGLWWGRKAKSLDDYMLAGRNVGLALGTATAMATWVTSNTTMLAPQFALELGVWGMLAYSTASFGLMLFAPLAQRIRSLMTAGYTSGDFIRLRFGRPAWGVFLVISFFYGLTWLISMGMAGGLMLNALSGIPYQAGLTVILTVCVLYTLVGGLFAVIGTDYIQSIIILFGIVIVGYFVMDSVDVVSVHENLSEQRPGLLSVLLPAAVMAVFNNMLFGMGEIFHSNVWWSRALAMKEGVGWKAYLLGGLFWLPIPIAAGFIALASDSLGVNITSPDMVGPLVAAQVLGQFGSVLVLIVIFCSLASSIDSLLAALSDLLTQDVYCKIFRPDASETELRRAAGYIVIGLGLATWLVCLPRIGTLATVLFFAGPLVGSTIWPIIAGLFWKKTNTNGVIAAMVCGSIGGLVAYFSIGWYCASLVGAAISMLIVVLSTALKPEDFDWRNLAQKPHT